MYSTQAKTVSSCFCFFTPIRAFAALSPPIQAA
jgi:hypothetical protein